MVISLAPAHVDNFSAMRENDASRVKISPPAHLLEKAPDKLAGIFRFFKIFAIGTGIAKENSVIRLTVAAIHLSFAACLPDQQIKIKL